MAVCCSFSELNLSLNASKKVTLFSSRKDKQKNIPPIVAPDGSVIEVADAFKYLAILIDDSLSLSLILILLQKAAP